MLRNSKYTCFLFKRLKKLFIHVAHALVSLFILYISCNIAFTECQSMWTLSITATEYKLNFSDMLQSLVGQQNARHGIIKIFNALQETRANKHLLYVSNLKPTKGLTISSVLHFYSHMRVDFNSLYS